MKFLAIAFLAAINLARGQVTNSPTPTPEDKWFASGGSSWPAGYCELTNLHYDMRYGLPSDTQLECCKTNFGAQTTGTCLSKLDSPPTTAPTLAGGLAGFWYPDYDAPWTDAGCLNALPLAFTRGDRPEYATHLECCQKAYGGQPSGLCLSELESPPTNTPTSLTGTAGVVTFYPDYDIAWSDGICVDTFPKPFNDGDRPEYDTLLDCCKGAYGGQTSGKCLSELESPPTGSPTASEGEGSMWYPDYDLPWNVGLCRNTIPKPFNDGDRPEFESQLDCCKGTYGGQTSDTCLGDLESPPTSTPTAIGGEGDKWYPDYDSPWSEAGCLSTVPKPFDDGDRPEYDSHLECCKAAYGGQSSGLCLSELESPPTGTPTAIGGEGDKWYPDHDSPWSVAGCLNTVPKPFNDGDRPEYDSHLECCKIAYGGQPSGQCLSELESPPTGTPTTSELEGSEYYPDFTLAWSNGLCTNLIPLPFGEGDRPMYASKLECCKAAYGGQGSGACLADLDSPPTTAPTATMLEEYYPDYSLAWPSGVCVNDYPLPSGRPTFESKEACCTGAYTGQVDATCMCDVDPCVSCKCGADSATCPDLNCDSGSGDK